jgi:hypothetical protein
MRASQVVGGDFPSFSPADYRLYSSRKIAPQGKL